MGTQTVDDLVTRVLAAADPGSAPAKAAYLKAVPGRYAEGDVVVGVRVPDLRAIARAARKDVTLDDVSRLLDHEVHEVRHLAAILLADLFRPKRVAQETKEAIVDLVIDRADRLDNWDLVDTVAPHTLGPWLLDRSPDRREARVLPLAADASPWRRRLALVAMLPLVRAGDTTLPHRLTELLADDDHVLVRRAVPWVSREVSGTD